MGILIIKNNAGIYHKNTKKKQKTLARWWTRLVLIFAKYVSINTYAIILKARHNNIRIKNNKLQNELFLSDADWHYFDIQS